MAKLTASKVLPKLTHRKFSPGRQVTTGKGSAKMGSVKGTAFKKPPVAKVGKSRKK